MNTKKLIGRMIAFALVLIIGLLGSSQASAHYDPPAAHFAAYPDSEIVDGFTWPKADGSQDWQLGESVNVTLSIYDQPGGTRLYQETRPTYLVTSENPNYTYESQVHFQNLAGLDLTPGQYVVMEGSGVTKTHVVANLAVTTVNADADLLIGTADPGQTVEVIVCNADPCFTVFATTDAAGNWSADFTGIEDIVPGTPGLALFREPGHPNDDGGDLTIIEWSVWIPSLSAWTEQDRVEANGWPLGSEVTLTAVDDGVTTYTLTSTMITPPWDPGGTWTNFDLPFDLNAGDEITITDGLITKSHVVTGLTVEEVVNEAANTVAGTAEPGSQVNLSIHEVNGFEFSVFADSNGDWLADFDTDPPVPHDLVPGTGITITQFDKDGDWTHVERSVPYTRIDVSLTHDWINVQEFTGNASVSVEVYDAPGGNLIFGPASYPTDGGGFAFIENFQHGIDLIPGMYVVVTDEASGASKDLTLEDLSLDNLDFDGNTVDGTAPPEADVEVNVGNEFIGYSRQVQADLSGYWFADFNPDDLADDMGAQARLVDWDGDATVAEPPEPPPLPYFTVQPDHRWVEGEGWPIGVDINVTVDDDADPNNGILFSATETSYPADWDPNLGIVWFDLSEVGNLARGMYVTMTDGTTTKYTWIADLYYDSLDQESGIATGRGPANQIVGVWVATDSGDFTLEVTVDSNGDWVADFTSVGFDLATLQDTNAKFWDEDLDETMAHLPEPPEPPAFSASLTFNWIEVQRFTPDSNVTIQVFAYQGGPLLLGPETIPTDGGGFAWFEGNEYGIDLLPGMFIVVTDDSGLTKELELADISLDVFDPDSDIVSGSAPDGAWLQVDAGNESMGYGFEVQSIGGIWTADFGAEGFDITPDMGSQARLFDEDGDATVAEPPPPPVLHARPSFPEVHGHHWPSDAYVWLTITRPSTGETYTAEKPVNHEPLEFCDNPCFDLRGVWDLQPGDIVTMEDDQGHSLTVHVTALTITAEDLATDTVWGTAEPFTDVWVYVTDVDLRHVIADADGNWIADFSVVGDEEFEQGTVDLVPGIGWRAIQFENEYPDDGTLEYWPIEPWFVDGAIAPTPVMIGSEVTVSADFLGHTYDTSLSTSPIVSMEYILFGVTDWTPMSLDGSGPLVTGTATLSIDTPGVYAVGVRAFDAAGMEAGGFLGFLVVYDPDGGFVTGGGWIWSPAGAYTPDPTLEGKASFGFVAKYQKGADVPSGQTEFQFKIADLNFKSTSYEWLVVAGRKAMFKGVGTINGEGEYKFMLTAIDGDLQGGDGTDTFRIRIWYEDEFGNEVVVYDNQLGDYPDADPFTALGGGSIVIHKSK